MPLPKSASRQLPTGAVNMPPSRPGPNSPETEDHRGCEESADASLPRLGSPSPSPLEGSKKKTPAVLLAIFVDWACDEEGSKKLAHFLDEASSDDLEALVDEIQEKVTELATHPLGSLSLQQLLYKAPCDSTLTVLRQCVPLIPNLCNHPPAGRLLQWGCQAAGKAVPKEVVDAVMANLPVMLSDRESGWHILQLCVDINPDFRGPLAKSVVGMVHSLMKTKTGCKLLQQAVTAADEPTLARYIEDIAHDLRPFATDRYGNYVVQAMLKAQKDCVAKLAHRLRGYYPLFAKHKHASLVVEKAYEISPPPLRKAILQEMAPYLELLALNEYGNFVIQALFKCSSDEEKAYITATLQPSMAKLRCAPHGRSVWNVLAKGGPHSPPPPPSTTRKSPSRGGQTALCPRSVPFLGKSFPSSITMARKK